MGLHLIRHDTKIDFVGFRKIAFLISGLLILFGIISLVVHGGPRYGVDFAGGSSVQVKFDKPVEIKNLKDALDKSGLQGLTVQRFGSEQDNVFLIRSMADEHTTTDKIKAEVETAVKSGAPGTAYEIQRLEMVGPKVGADLRAKALQAIFYSLLFISIYISGRFEQRWFAAGIMAAGLSGGLYVLELIGAPMVWMILAAILITLVLCFLLKLKYALGAVVALIHDVLVPVGIFSMLGKEFDLTIVAALLTIIGYSLNDTIIIYDRIRENLHAKNAPTFAGIINMSVNQTLSRTILTSGTAMIAVLCLFFLGGSVIHDFALALVIGIITGTYSSIYVASPILLVLVPGDELLHAAPKTPAVKPAKA